MKWNKNEVVIHFWIMYVMLNSGGNFTEFCFFSQFYSNSSVHLLILMAFIISIDMQFCFLFVFFE